MLVVHATLGVVGEVIEVANVEMVTRVFVPEWTHQNVRVMLGAADEVIEVANVEMVIHVCVMENEENDQSRFLWILWNKKSILIS